MWYYQDRRPSFTVIIVIVVVIVTVTHVWRHLQIFSSCDADIRTDQHLIQWVGCDVSHTTYRNLSAYYTRFGHTEHIRCRAAVREESAYEG